MQSDEDFKITIAVPYHRSTEYSSNTGWREWTWHRYQDYSNIKLNGKWEILVIDEVPELYFGIDYDNTTEVREQIEKEVEYSQDTIFSILGIAKPKTFTRIRTEYITKDKVTRESDMVPESDLVVSRIYKNNCGEIDE